MKLDICSETLFPVNNFQTADELICCRLAGPGGDCRSCLLSGLLLIQLVDRSLDPWKIVWHTDLDTSFGDESAGE